MKVLNSYRIPAVLLGVMLCTMMAWALPSADEASVRSDERPTDCVCRYCAGDGCRCVEGVCRQCVACPVPAEAYGNAPVCRAHHRSECADCFLMPSDVRAGRVSDDGLRMEETADRSRRAHYYHRGRHYEASYRDYDCQAPCCVADEEYAPAEEHCNVPVRRVRTGRHCCGAR